MIGFLHISDLYLRKSCASHGCLLTTYKPWHWAQFGPLFSLLLTHLGRGSMEAHAWDSGTFVYRKKERERVAVRDGGYSFCNTYLEISNVSSQMSKGE